MRLDLTRHAPPGMDIQGEKDVFSVGMIFSAIYSLRFFYEYANDAWIIYVDSKKAIIREGALMTDFAYLIEDCLMGFGIVACVMVGFLVWHYFYHTQGSHSIYLMRRLPDRWELHRRCLTLPLAAIILCGLMALALLLLYFAYYMLHTPEQCIRPGQWQMLWRELL